MSIVHLGVRTPWSLGRGASSIVDLCDAAQRRGIAAIGFTDRNSLAAAVPAWRACRRAGVQPVLGAELIGGERRCWVIARNLRGYSAACAAVTRAQLDADFDPLEQLRRDSDGLTVLADEPRVIRALMKFLPRTRLRVGVLPWNVEHGASAARALGLPPVALSDAHFSSPADRTVHELLRARACRTAADAVPAGECASQRAWLAGERVERQWYSACPTALHEARRLVQECTFDLERDLGFGRPRFPRVPIDEVPHRALAARCRAGLRRLKGTDCGAYGAQLARELAVIGELGFVPYFLMLGDLVEFCRRGNIPHRGRGSAAGSVVAWSLGLTQVDPLAHGLLFERFLSRERGDLPDVDLDLDWRRRAEVVDHLVATHGADRVSGVATHVRFGVRGGIREMGKVLGVPGDAVARLSRAMAHHRDLEQSTAGACGHRHGVDVSREPFRGLLAAARAVQRLPRHLGLHPSGLVVGAQPLARSMPLFRSATGVVASQWMRMRSRGPGGSSSTCWATARWG